MKVLFKAVFVGLLLSLLTLSTMVEARGNHNRSEYYPMHGDRGFYLDGTRAVIEGGQLWICVRISGGFFLKECDRWGTPQAWLDREFPKGMRHIKTTYSGDTVRIYFAR